MGLVMDQKKALIRFNTSQEQHEWNNVCDIFNSGTQAL